MYSEIPNARGLRLIAAAFLFETLAFLGIGRDMVQQEFDGDETFEQ